MHREGCNANPSIEKNVSGAGVHSECLSFSFETFYCYPTRLRHGQADFQYSNMRYNKPLYIIQNDVDYNN